MASAFLCFQAGFMASTESAIILVLCILLLRSLVFCMYEGRAASGSCTANITDLSCSPYGLTFYQSRIWNERFWCYLH
jgi:hypothetical protein